MLTDVDRSFLKELDDQLWPPNKKQNGIVLRSDHKITPADWKRVCKIIESAGLVCTMFSKGMFGGYGMDVHEVEDPIYPGVPTTTKIVLRLTEDNLPVPKRAAKKIPGCGLDHAWDAFSKYTHSNKTRALVKQYNLPAPREQSYYDY